MNIETTDITEMSDLGMDVFFAVKADDTDSLNFDPTDLTRADMDVLIGLKNDGVGFDARTWGFIFSEWRKANTAAGTPRWVTNSPDYEGQILSTQANRGDYD